MVRADKQGGTGEPTAPAGWRSPGDLGYIGVFTLIWLAHAYLVRRFWFVTDDAFISYRYSHNLAMGHGLRYNLTESVPVEGYSNFLWVIIGAVVEWLRLDITFLLPLLSAGCGSALLLLVFDRLHRRLGLSLPVAGVAALSLGFFPPYALWSTGGLATMPFALLIFLVFDRLVLRADDIDGVGAGICGLLLGLVRVEGIAWVVVMAVMALVSRWLAGQRRLRPWLPFVLVVGVGCGVYFGWRWWYFQSLLPNTAYAKAGLSAALLQRGFDYVAVYALSFVTPLLLVVTSWFVLRRGRRAIGLAVAAMAWAFPAYAIVTAGDFMAMGRFLVPGLAFNTILLAWMLEDLGGQRAWRRGAALLVGLAVVVLGALPGWDRHLVPHNVRANFHFRRNTPNYLSEYGKWQQQVNNRWRWRLEGLALKAYTQENFGPGASTIAGAIGALGYYSGLHIYDMNGLVTPEVGRREVKADERMRSPGHDKNVAPWFFLDDQPSLVYFNLHNGETPRQVAEGIAHWGWTVEQQWPRTLVSRGYVPDLVRLTGVDEPGGPWYLVVLRHTDAPVNRERVWALFRQMLRRLATDGTAPTLSVPPEE
ncbi:MAG: hypothetical protein PVJ57_00160 [Phycisphaerae bacterium]